MKLHVRYVRFKACNFILVNFLDFLLLVDVNEWTYNESSESMIPAPEHF